MADCLGVDVRKPKPCTRCGAPKPEAAASRKLCGLCSPVDAVWPQLQLSPSGCWIWPGRTCKGYGRYGEALVHRMTYEALVTEIPDGLDLDHLCRVITCANPYHLEPVTRAENNRRKWALHTHCPAGHEFTTANTYTGGGHRKCRICNAASQRRSLQKRRLGVTG